MELRWVCGSANGLEDKLANEGVGKDSSKLDTTWLNIPNDQLRIDCIQLATNDREGRLSKEGHIKKGNERPGNRQAKPKKDVIVEHSITNDHAGSA
jgi:hypothetical protein